MARPERRRIALVRGANAVRFELAVAALQRVPVLLGQQLHNVATIHPDPLDRVAGGYLSELGSMPEFQPGMLGGVARAECRFTCVWPVGRLLPFGDVPVGE
jgi:hypothetical protein